MNKSKNRHLDVEIIRLYNTGKGVYAIAKALGIKPRGVYYRLDLNGVETRSISESMVGRPKSQEHRKSVSEVRRAKGVAKGSLNPNWRGGVSPEHEKIRHNADQMLWKKAVKERDGYCKSCGDRKKLHAHHILPFATHPHLRTSIENGITLCKGCHTKLHRGAKSTCRELLETLPVNDEGNQQPSPKGKVQRLCTAPERDDIVQTRSNAVSKEA